MNGSTETLLRRALFVAAGIFAFLSALIKIGDYDIWYHLKAGELILKTGAVRHIEPFAYTVPDAAWSVQSWLAGVIFYAIYSIGDLSGLIIFNALVVTLTFIFVLLTMKLHAPEGDEGGLTGVLMAAVLVVAVFAVRFRMPIRPHVIEFLFLAFTVYALSACKTKNKKYVYALPIVQALWVNIHGSHILGLMVPLIFIVGMAIDSFLQKKPAPIKTLVVIFILNVLATLLNPTAHEALLFPFMLTGQKTYMQNINEWMPLGLEHVWGYGLRYTWGYVALVILALAGFAARPKKISAVDALLFIAFFVMTIKGVRLIAEFAIIVSPLIIKNLAPLTTRIRGKAPSALAALALALIIFLALPSIVKSKTYSFGLGVKNVFPERAAKFVEENDIQGEIFNSFGFGDYLVWRFYPQRKVFIHGRNDVIPQSLYVKYLDAHEKPDVWRELADRYNVHYTMLEYYQTDYGGEEAIAHLSHDETWAPVYWDRLAIVYVKVDPLNANVLEKWAYRYIKPNYLDFSYLNKFDRETITGPVMNELARLIASSPANEEAFLTRAYIYFKLGRDYYDLSAQDLKSALEINPEQAATHAALGMIYERKGNKDEAERSYQKALKIDPQDPGALAGIKRLRG